MKKFAIILVPLLLMACSSTPRTDSSQSSQPNGANNSSGKGGSGGMMGGNIDSSKLATDINTLQKQSIYFDFDDFSIKPEYLNVIQQQAAFLKAHMTDIVTIEGNADERGSDEYNLALGDRRANAARKNLEQIGVSAAQIKTVSLGVEKPRLTCHEEKCWKENRRDDFIHKLN